MVSEKIARKTLKLYGEAWVNQDTEKILSIFTKDATYQESIFKKPFRGRNGIMKYWQSKVVQEQSDIRFKLLKYYICGNTVVAEWKASFKSNKEKAKFDLREVAILEFSGNKIKSLREYWQHKKYKLR